MKTSRLLAAMTAATTVVLVGCSSSGKTHGPSTTGPGASATTGSAAGNSDAAFLAEVSQTVQTAEQGLSTPPPTSGPAAVKGKHVYVISCTQAAPGCSEPAAGFVAAAKVLGWDATLIDGKATPSVYSSSLAQAIAAHPDGIYLDAIDCELVKSELQQAKAANIPVVTSSAFDCNDPMSNAGPPLFTASVMQSGTAVQFYELWGKLKADFAIDATHGAAKIIQVTQPGFFSTGYALQQYKQEFSKCTGCSVVATTGIAAADLGTPATVAQKISTILQQNPNANVLEIPDDTVLEESAQAITAFKQGHPNLIVIGGEGYAPTMDLVRNGVVTAEVAFSNTWVGWDAADTLNRVLAGQPTIPNQGTNFQIVTKTTGLPPSGQDYTPTIDYQAAFTKVWAGG